MYEYEKEEILKETQLNLAKGRLCELIAFTFMGANMALFGTDFIMHKQLTGCSVAAIVCLGGMFGCLQLAQKFINKAVDSVNVLKPQQNGEEGK